MKKKVIDVFNVDSLSTVMPSALIEDFSTSFFVMSFMFDGICFVFVNSFFELVS